MINDMLIEAIVATGLRQKPVFRWAAIANDLKTIISSIAQGEVVIPTLTQDQAHINREIGLAYIVSNIHEKSEKSYWPLTGLRRQSTIALQMGFEIAQAVEKYPYFTDKISDYLDFAFTAEAVREEISIYGLCLATAIQVYLTKNDDSQHLLDVCNKYTEVIRRNVMRENLLNEVKENLTNSPEHIGTLFFANIASTLFGEQGNTYPPVKPEEDGAQVEQGERNQETGEAGQSEQGERNQETGKASQAGQGELNQETGEAGQAEQGEPNQKTEEVEPKNNESLDKETSLAEIELFGPAKDEDESQVTCVVVSGSAGAEVGKNSMQNRIEIEDRTNGMLVATIIKIFQSTEEQPTGLSKSGSKLSIKHAWRMKTFGDTCIFKKRREDPGVSMAMSILVDRSDSMDSLLEEVCCTAHTFAIGLTRVPGAKVRIAAFPAVGPDSTTTLLDFGEHTKRAEDRLSMLVAGGSTPLAQAIVAESSRLLETNEAKKVIAVLTDGKPDNGPQVKNAILRAESYGIEVIGIGFGDAQSIKNWIPISEYINEVDQLSNALASIYEQMLVTQH